MLGENDKRHIYDNANIWMNERRSAIIACVKIGTDDWYISILLTRQLLIMSRSLALIANRCWNDTIYRRIFNRDDWLRLAWISTFGSSALRSRRSPSLCLHLRPLFLQPSECTFFWHHIFACHIAGKYLLQWELTITDIGMITHLAIPPVQQVTDLVSFLEVIQKFKDAQVESFGSRRCIWPTEDRWGRQRKAKLTTIIDSQCWHRTRWTLHTWVAM